MGALREDLRTVDTKPHKHLHQITRDKMSHGYTSSHFSATIEQVTF